MNHQQGYTIKLTDAFKTHTLDQDKIVSPEETVTRFKKKIKELKLNILEETRRIDNGRLDIPVFFSVCGHDARKVTGTNKQMGKGATPQQSEASAVMELAERFSFFSYVNDADNFFTAPHAHVRDRAITFENIARSVHDESDDLGVLETVFADLPLRWAWGYSLTHANPVLIPFDWFFMINEFNGPSAGNCTEEAISQGICEIVERHVSSLVSRERLRIPGIDPASACDPMVKELLRKYASAGIRLFLSDFTLNMGIPTVGILAFDPANFPEQSEIVWTAGTTPNPEKALSRALTETAQLAGDFNSNANYVASGLPKPQQLVDVDFITTPDGMRPIQALPDISHANIRIEIENMVSALSKRNMEVLLIDTRHRDLDIAAFYTIVPGAHFRERAKGGSVGMYTAKMVFEKEPPPKALQWFRDFERQLPGKYYTSFFTARCHQETGDLRKARDSFETALERDPKSEDTASIYSYLGLCLKDMGQIDEALAAVEKGLDLDTRRTDLHNLKGFCHFKRKEYIEAIESFQEVIALDPSSAIDYANIGANYRALGRRKEAVAYFQTAIDMDATIEFAHQALEEMNHTKS
jgi:ribosomal protein S12 methylthiotransferase accessory factor